MEGESKGKSARIYYYNDYNSVYVKAFPFTIAVHAIGAAVIALVLVWQLHFRGGLAWSSTNKDHIFNIHPVLMVSGFVFVASEAIIIYKSSPGKKSSKKVVHLTLNGVALAAAVVGITAVFKYHNELHIQNLYSLHSWMGLTTVGLFTLQWMVGFFAFWFPGCSKEVGAGLLPRHVFLGLCTYVVAVATAETGILEKITFLQRTRGLGLKSPEARLANSLGLTLILLAVTVVLCAALPASSSVLPTKPSISTVEDSS